MNSEQLSELVVAALEEVKGKDIVKLNVSEMTSVVKTRSWRSPTGRPESWRLHMEVTETKGQGQKSYGDSET